MTTQEPTAVQRSITEARASGSVVGVGRAVNDDPPPLPFQALDRLGRARGALDDSIADLIGRLAPYMSGERPERTPEGTVIRESVLSPLENAIEEEILNLQELHATVVDVLAGMRL